MRGIASLGLHAAPTAACSVFMSLGPSALVVEPYRLPFRQPVRTAHGGWTEREGLYLRLEKDGVIGRGEVAPIPWFGTETVAEAAEMLARFGGRVDDDALARVPEKFGCVRFALACAREELARGLGASERETTDRAERETAAQGNTQARLPVAALLPAGRAALEELPRRLEVGYLAFKWKVGVGRPEDEWAMLDDLLAGLPAYARLRLDANGGWERRVAARWLERCAERPVEFVEQPLAPEDVDGLRGLAEDYPVTLALDESLVRLTEAREWQARGWPGVFVIKPALCGALTEIAAWARETKADVVLSSAIETAAARDVILNWAVRSGVTKRALGFGLGEIFESAEANGRVVGPLVGR